MQPYFFPYLGYFRLIEETDVFVVLDCVQFPRRGFVHRNKPYASGGWLTVPISKCGIDTKIKDVMLAEDYSGLMRERLAKFPILNNKLKNEDIWCKMIIERSSPDLCSLLLETLSYTCQNLGLDFEYVRSSEMDLDNELRGEDRIIKIVNLMGAETYVNSPGGADLYSEERFQNEGVSLRLLEPWSGSFDSVITTMLIGEY